MAGIGAGKPDGGFFGGDNRTTIVTEPIYTLRPAKKKQKTTKEKDRRILLGNNCEVVLYVDGAIQIFDYDAFESIYLTENQTEQLKKMFEGHMKKPPKDLYPTLEPLHIYIEPPLFRPETPKPPKKKPTRGVVIIDINGDEHES